MQYNTSIQQKFMRRPKTIVPLCISCELCFSATRWSQRRREEENRFPMLFKSCMRTKPPLCLSGCYDIAGREWQWMTILMRQTNSFSVTTNGVGGCSLALLSTWKGVGGPGRPSKEKAACHKKQGGVWRARTDMRWCNNECKNDNRSYEWQRSVCHV